MRPDVGIFTHRGDILETVWGGEFCGDLRNLGKSEEFKFKLSLIICNIFSNLIQNNRI